LVNQKIILNFVKQFRKEVWCEPDISSVVFKTTQFSESVAYSECSGVVVQDVQA